MFKRTPRLIMLCVALCALLAVGAASASAATVYVSNTSPVVPNGKSCAQPDFSEIQAAVTAAAPGSKVTVCPGSYTEQVQIEKGLKLVAGGTAGSAKVVMPATPAPSTTPCDSSQTDAVSICTPETVTLTGISVTAQETGTSCAGGLVGIDATGGGTFKATNLTVNGATQVPISGCQRGIGVEIGGGATTKTEKATLTKANISEYQKEGLAVEGEGSSLKLTSSKIMGVGPTTATAQNGVEIDTGVLYKIASSTISGNECENPTCGPAPTQYQAAGLLSFGAAPKSSVTSSTIKENDFGAYYVSEAASQPATAEVTFNKVAFTNNRDEGVLLDQGKASLKTDTITGDNVGIELYQYEGQTLASESTATGTKAEGSEASIKVNSDKAATDIPGVFTFSSGTLTGPIINENPPKFKIIL